jgi:hypothetical protein
VGESLVDDVQTATPPRGAAESRETSPLVADSRVVSPLRAIEGGEGATVGDVGAAVSSRIIDVNPISARPAGADDLVRDQPHIDQAPRGPGTSGAQVPESSSRARGYCAGKLTRMAPLGRMISSRIMMICRPCGPVS